MLIVAGALLGGVVIGLLVHMAWLRFALPEKLGVSTSGRRRRLACQAIPLARENLYSQQLERGLHWARRAVRFDRSNPEAHAVLAECWDALQQYELGLSHHRRAESLDLPAGQDTAVWRLQNALEAVQACMQLRGEKSEAEGQWLWDEAAAWVRLAYIIDATETLDMLSISPWLTPFAPGGEEWVEP